VRSLVTGGAGFIGSHLVDALLERGHEVRVVDNLLKPVHLFGRPNYLPPEVEFIEGDVSEGETMRRALRGVDWVFHQAAYQGFLPDFSTFFRTNTVSTALLLELIVTEKLPVQKVVVASSQAVYGEGKHYCPRCDAFLYPPPRPLEQLQRREWEVKCPQCDHPTEPRLTNEAHVDPHTQYAMSKYTQEMVSLRLGRRHGIPVTCLRYSITQGPRQSFFNAYSGILRIFTLRMLTGKPPVAYEDGLMQRDYVHVRDVVAANLLAIDDPRTDYEVYNVGSGVPTTVLEFAEVLARVLDTDLTPTVPGEFRLGDVRHIISEVSKLRVLGWQVTADLETIIRDYVTWVETFADLEDYFAAAERVLKAVGAVRRAA